MKTIRHLPLHSQLGGSLQRPPGLSTFRDEASGMANLRKLDDARRLRLINAAVNVALWALSAALLIVGVKLFNQ